MLVRNEVFDGNVNDSKYGYVVSVRMLIDRIWLWICFCSSAIRWRYLNKTND